MTQAPSLPVISFEHGGQRLEVVETMTDLDNEKVKVLRNVNACPLDRAHARGMVDHIQHQAGEAFHENWKRIIVGPLSCPDLDRIPGEASHGEGNGEARARQWLNRVEEAVGVDSYELLRLICGEEYSFDEAFHAFNARMHPLARPLPRKDVGPRLCEALDALAQHIGLTQRASCGIEIG